VPIASEDKYFLFKDFPFNISLQIIINSLNCLKNRLQTQV